ncbi:MAG: hypothetical protein KAS29_07155 [Bacteroidales bacterium]|nr:hypothetical protein [Bacteroidales bacterium]
MRLFMFIIILLFFSQSGKAQIEAHWIDTTQYSASDKAYFFTNRKPKKSDDGSVAFRNRWTRQTDNLYFSVIDYESDSILLKYQATKICEKHEYPTEAVENNMEMHLKSIRYLSLMHGEPRLCHSGPRNLEMLPDNVRIWDITNLISWNDLPAMGHDYFLRNQELRDSLINMQSKFP